MYTYIANTSNSKFLNIFDDSLFCDALDCRRCPPEENLDYKVDNFDSADDWEASEEAHGASDETDLALQLDLLVSLDLVEGGRVKVDLDNLQLGFW